jgi:acyl transferase domain-containing protein
MTKTTSPIAVVGMACRLPGAPSLEAYWELLCKGVDAISEVPAARWSVDEFRNADPSAQGRTHARWGGFIDHIDQFDAAFFGISPREVQAVSPQQRLLLEVCWHAVENAGMAMSDLSAKHAPAGRGTGVFVGVASFDYYDRAVQDPDRMDGYSLTGNAYSVTANRLSYVFDLNGPSIAVDTACSSSLVAIHLACQSLANGECSVALAGGAQIMLSPWINIAASKGEFLAPDGRCKSFDERANGYVRGEGLGMVVLKRLEDAQRDGDPIWAVIHGSAVNQDGRSNGLTAPNPAAQIEVVGLALERAGIAPSQLGYIEAHGTGTKLGDPIELNALGRLLGQREQPCFVGSVKTNFGHLEAAAGVAGFIKAVLCVNRGAIVPNLHFERPNPLIDFDRLPLTVPTRLQDWPAGLPRYAGVSSFGFGGTNAHVIVGMAPESPAPDKAGAPQPALLCLSARTRPSLERLLADYAALVQSHPDTAPGSLAAAVARGRVAFRERCAVVLGAHADKAVALTRAAAQWRAAGAAPTAGSARRPRIAFVFTGQGSQYPGMGRALWEHFEVFRDTWHQADALLRESMAQPLSELVYGSAASAATLAQTRYTQLALYVLQVGLVRVLRQCGVKPSQVLGHSVGEFAAAVAGGTLTFEDGLRLVDQRSQSMQACRADGAMLAVQQDRAVLSASLARLGGGAVIAVVNGPNQIVVSGTQESIGALEEALAEIGTPCRRLQVSHAFHSTAMAPAARALAVVAATVPHAAPGVPFISSKTGALVPADTDWAGYWPEQMLAPVEFERAARCLMAQEPELVIELGPRPTLSALLAAQFPAAKLACALDPSETDHAALLGVLGRCFEAGLDLDDVAVHGRCTGPRPTLPAYPFERQMHPLYPPVSVTTGSARVRPFEHDWTRDAQVEADEGGRYSVTLPLGSRRFPYLGDHTVFQADVLPATGFIELAQAAAHRVSGKTAWLLEQLEFRRPLVLGPEDRRIRIDLVPIDEAGWQFTVTQADSKTGHAGSERSIFSCGVLRERRRAMEGA